MSIKLQELPGGPLMPTVIWTESHRFIDVIRDELFFIHQGQPKEAGIHIHGVLNQSLIYPVIDDLKHRK